MPAIQIDELGTQFYYHDTGVPALTDIPYTTLVVLHGYSFNSHSFYKVMPLAAGSHIRLVLVNRRGYQGSTPLTELETNPIDPAFDSDNPDSHPDRRLERYTAFLQARAAEIAKFLVKFIEIESIPPKTESVGRASGGVAILGWSLANIHSLSLLAFGNTFDPDVVSKLNAYLRKVILYDPPYHTLGYPTPGGYNPLFDSEIPLEQKHPHFIEWATSYYSHSPALLDPKTPVSKLLHGVLEQRKGNPAKIATIYRFTPTDISRGVETVTKAHGDPLVALAENGPVNRDIFLKALFGDLNEKNSLMAFPNIHVSYVWCTESPWETPYATRSVQAEIESPPANRYVQRRIDFFMLEGANHFIHFDDPLKALAMLALALEN